MSTTRSADWVRMIIPTSCLVPDHITAPAEVPVLTWLRYDRGDPLAVTLAFRTSGAWVEWVFARDLLIAGVHMPAGEGDVQFWPLDDGRTVRLSLTSPHGTVEINLSRAAIQIAVARMLAVVPVGAEDRYADFGHDLARWLDGVSTSMRDGE